MRFPLKLNLTMASYFLKKGLAKEKRYPLVLMLEPLHACNLACKGCGRIREYRDTLDQQLTADECIESAIQCGAPVVSISGGEPMLYKDLTALISLSRANTIKSGSTAAEDTGNPRARNRPSEAWKMSSSTTYRFSSRKVTKGPAPLRLPHPAPSFIRWK